MKRAAVLVAALIVGSACAPEGNPPGDRAGDPGAPSESPATPEPAPRMIVDDAGVEVMVHEVERTPTPELLPVAEAARLLREGEAVLCDVNAPEARAYFGVVPGALELSHPSHFELDELPSDRGVPLIFYCSTPSCGASLRSGTRAILAGYTEVYALRGGIMAWLDAGRETTEPAAQGRESP
jgi:rhodanese-related sulfurtransferase